MLEAKTGPPAAIQSAPVAVAASDPEIRTRITAALAAGGLAWSFGLESTAVVLGCDVSSLADIAVLRRVRKESADRAVVVVCPATHASAVRRALEAGADAVVFDSELENSLVASIAAVVSGQTVVPRRARCGLHRPAFSHRERQVLACIAKGLTNRQIADALFLSESTVKSHLSSAFAKLGVKSRREATAVLLDSPDSFATRGVAVGDPVSLS